MTDVTVINDDNSDEMAEEFIRDFYKQVDNARHLTSNFYKEEGVGFLTWTSNGITRPISGGNHMIQKFRMNLPPSKHVLKSLNSVRGDENFTMYKFTYEIKVCGDVTYQNEETKKFNQTFTIVAIDGKWKIVIDAYTIEDP